MVDLQKLKELNPDKAEEFQLIGKDTVSESTYPPDYVFPMDGPRMRNAFFGCGAVLIVLFIIIAGIGGYSASTASAETQLTSEVTDTPMPPASPMIIVITATQPIKPVGGATVIAPTQTALPTVLPSITPTPPYGDVYTWTPGPWLVTKFAQEEYAKTPTVDPNRVVTVTAQPSATGPRG